jgi:MFS family permease
MQTTSHDGQVVKINPPRLFTGSCFSLIATATAFAMIGAIMGPLKEQFILTNEQVGWIGGAALRGFTISIFIFGPLCDALGMKFLLNLAFIGHAAGVLIMIWTAKLAAAFGIHPFVVLFTGALVLSMGNGLVEAACNPLVTTIYPDRKTQMLNRFHMWFPGGIAIGGLIAFGLDSAGLMSWQVKLAVILIPTVIYGFLFLGQKFPATERLASGVSFGQMLKNTFMRPLFIVLFFCMMITASLELGPNRWTPTIYESVHIPGILILVWTSVLMALLRFYAGPIVHKLSPTGVLLSSAIVAGTGLVLLSYSNSLVTALASATVFAVGVCYFWPTMLGVTSERVPKGGALALALMGGIGMAIVGLVTSPMMGKIADKHINEMLPQNTMTVLENAVAVLPSAKTQVNAKDIDGAVQFCSKIISEYKQSNVLPKDSANALRSVMAAAPDSEPAKQVKELLGPAENYGGRISFRRVAPFSIVLIVVFGILYIRDKMTGGYKIEKLKVETVEAA